jgi:hypothetical protein
MVSTIIEDLDRHVGDLSVDKAVNMIYVNAMMSRQNLTRQEPLSSQEHQECEVTSHIDPEVVDTCPMS